MTSRINRDEQGKFLPGISGNPDGRKPEQLEQKIAKKAVKELIKEYKEGLTEALKEIQPVLIKKAIEGDIAAIKELHDRAMGKPESKTDITSGGKPIPILGGLTNDIQKDESPE